MANKEEYALSLEDAKAIEAKDIKTPYMPVGIYLQEAEDLHRWALKDKAALCATGLSEQIFDDVNNAAGGLREAQSAWMEDLKTRQLAEQRWIDESPAAFEQRDYLLRTYRYAFRNNDDILDRISVIAEGSSNADMIQDLNDLAILGERNTAPLLAINFDMSNVDKAAALSGEMADLRGMANGEKYDYNESLFLRNQMYTLLKSYVDELRQCGKYVFFGNEKRMIGYSSRYNRMKN